MAPLNIKLVGASGHGAQPLADALNHYFGDSHHGSVNVIVTDEAAQPLAADLVLLMGLDNLSSGATDADADASIRAALFSTGTGYAVLYGSHEDRYEQAVTLVHRRLAVKGMTSPPAGDTIDLSAKTKPWVWHCDKCSDPQCEHQLLTALLAGRLTVLSQEAVAGDRDG